jgi:hypothetical protein
MIVTRTSEWYVVNQIPSDFDVVGDIASRYCKSVVGAPEDNVPHVVSPNCVCPSIPDCPPDFPVKTF